MCAEACPTDPQIKSKKMCKPNDLRRIKCSRNTLEPTGTARIDQYRDGERAKPLTSETSSLFSACSSSAMADAPAFASETLFLKPSAPIPAPARSRSDRTRGADSIRSVRDARRSSYGRRARAGEKENAAAAA